MDLRVPGAPGAITRHPRRALRARVGAGGRGAACPAAALGARADVGSMRRGNTLRSRLMPRSSAMPSSRSWACSSCRASPVPCSPSIPRSRGSPRHCSASHSAGRSNGDRTRAFRRIAIAGVMCLAVFVALRASGGFGSFQPVEPGWIGFLNVTKYPPSLTFLLLTLGANFVLLGSLELSGCGRSKWLAPLRVFGSVPLFFFITHLWLYGAIGRFFPGRDDDRADVSVLVARSGPAVPAVPVVWRVQRPTAFELAAAAVLALSRSRARRQFDELRPRIPTVT